MTTEILITDMSLAELFIEIQPDEISKLEAVKYAEKIQSQRPEGRGIGQA